MAIQPNPRKARAGRSTPKASRAEHAAREVTADHPVSVFLSYKLSNREAAKRLESELKMLSCDALKVFFAERIDPSDRWSNEIHENLKNADCLIVLYTDPTEEWDWCLYEAGYFSGCRADHPPRLYCLHPEGFEPPAPLRGYKSVPGTRDGVHEFLRSLFAAPLVEGAKPIFPTLFGDDEHFAKMLDEHVQAIQKLIAPYQPNVKQTRWHVPHLEVTVPKDGLDSLRAGQIVDTARVVLNTAARELFLRKAEGAPELLWDEFVKALSAGAPESGEEAKEWVADFLDRARTSIQLSGKVTQMPAFRTLEDGPLFSACLYTTEELMNGGVRLHVVFSEERPPLSCEFEQAERFVCGVFLLLERFREEAITEIRQRIPRATKRGEVAQQECMAEFRRIVSLIARAARHRNIYLMKQVGRLFDAADQKREEKQQACEGFRDVIKILYGCVGGSDPPGKRWETFDEYHGKLSEITEFLLAATAQEVSKVFPAQAAPPQIPSHAT